MNMTASDIGFFVERERGRPRRYKFCKSCQASYSGDVQHPKSVIHRQGRRIRALLAQNCLTFEEIGRRIGVTKEYVRQLAQRIGSETGRVRQKSCTRSKAGSKESPGSRNSPKTREQV